MLHEGESLSSNFQFNQTQSVSLQPMTISTVNSTLEQYTNILQKKLFKAYFCIFSAYINRIAKNMRFLMDIMVFFWDLVGIFSSHLYLLSRELIVGSIVFVSFRLRWP